MKTIEPQGAVSQFLVSILPDATRRSYELLAGLNYPLNDYDALAREIKACDNVEKQDTAQIQTASSILKRLTPKDFPIVSVQGALEKFHVRLQLPDLSRFVPPLWIPPESFETPENNFSETYRALFGPRCGPQAFQAYLEAKAQRLNELEAFNMGLVVGRQCV